MSVDIEGSEDIRGEFVYLANELSNRFPQLDLRFNLKSGSSCCRVVVPSQASHVIELTLGEVEPEILLYEAVFAVKELVQLYDA